MPEENLKNLFLAFGKQEDKLNLNREGTGLGLSICKHIIEQMGGVAQSRYTQKSTREPTSR